MPDGAPAILLEGYLMARIRTIKPEFWSDAAVGECSVSARLLFIASWNFADDHGGLDRSAKQLKAQAFPYDSIDCEPLIQELLNAGLLIEYAASGKKYLHIKSFRKHQRVEKPSNPRIPLYEESTKAMEGSTTTPRAVTVSSLEGKGRDLREDRTAAAPPRAKKVNQDPAWLLDFKLAYPKRGGDPGWRAAVRAAHARIREGHTSVQFIEGAQRYAAYIAATGKTDTEFVKQAATFLGPDKPFLLSWDLPARTNGLDPAAETVWNELVASDGAKRDDRIQRAIEAVGGWLRIQLRTAFDSPLIKREFCAAWVSAGVGSRANGGHT